MKLKIITILTLLIFGISAVSATGLNVILANQNPDPVTPGNFVFVNIKLTNTNSEDTASTFVSIIDDNHFKLAQGEDRRKNLGVIPALSSSTDSSSFIIAKYKVYVEENTPIGLNTLSLTVEESGKTYNYEFDILVQDSNPTIELVSSTLEEDFLKAGDSQQYTLTFENKNNVVLKDVIITLDLSNVEGQVLSTKSGSNQFYIDTISGKQQEEITLNLVATPNSDSKPYLLPITIEYEDALGNTYTKSVVSSVQIYSKPELTLELESQTKYTTGNGRYTLSIANPSPTTAKGVELRIISEDAYEVLDGGFQYIGDLDSDDFQTLQSDIFVFNDDAVLKVELNYLDAYNKKITETREISLQLYSEDRLNELGLSGESDGGFSFTTIIVLLIVGFGAFFFGRSKGYKKARKN
jgi:hypothetical protein